MLYLVNTVPFHSIQTSRVTGFDDLYDMSHLSCVTWPLFESAGALMPNKAIKGPIRRRAGVGLDPVTLLLGGVRNQNFEQVVTGHTLV